MTWEEIKNQDRFFTRLSFIVWLYWNPDALSGDQFVVNAITRELFYEATDKLSSPEDVFDYIQGCCKQYCYDIGQSGWFDARREFFGKPLATGRTENTLYKIGCWFDDRKEVFEILEWI